MFKLYMHWISQPSRAVAWGCLINGSKFTPVFTNPVKGQTRTAEFKQIFHGVTQIPAVQFNDGKVLCESGAILQYLGEDWGSWYGGLNKFEQAQVSQYLHWHHFNLRLACTDKLFRPTMMGLMGGNLKPPEQKQFRRFDKACTTLESTLQRQRFLASAAQPTIADLQAYCELDQLEIMGILPPGFEARYPKLSAWMGEMKALPFYAESHKALHSFRKVLDQQKAKQATTSKL
jgi:glutathione S-transferase